MSITWNTGSAAARFRHNLKLKLKNKKHQASSIKHQASSRKPQAASRKHHEKNTFK